jgi:hypothetical protein
MSDSAKLFGCLIILLVLFIIGFWFYEMPNFTYMYREKTEPKIFIQAKVIELKDNRNTGRVFLKNFTVKFQTKNNDILTYSEETGKLYYDSKIGDTYKFQILKNDNRNGTNLFKLYGYQKISN